MSDWMTIRVVLVGQTGDELPSPPARVLLAHADHAFSDLAEAIDTSFGRWDLTPIHQFEVEGRLLLTAGAGDGDAEDSDEVTIGEVGLRAGARFAYVFDLGEGWTHECTVEDVAVDPFELTGEEPELPVPVYGWGTIPDQYGRVAEDDDEGAEPTDGDEDDLEEDDLEEDVDADELEDWDAAESASWKVVSKALGGSRPEPDRGELAAVVARLREDEQGWERDVLWAAADLDPEDGGDSDESLWIDLAAGVVAPGEQVPLDAETAAAWATLEPADWAGAVIELVRSGAGTATTPDSVIELIARCPEVESDDLTEEDEAVILDGLGVVISLWKALGAVDDDDALTALGQWGLPLALERAWAPSIAS